MTHGRKERTTLVDHHELDGPSADAGDGDFAEPPLLLRLGTLAELTQGAIGIGDDALGGWSGDQGASL